MNARMDGTGQPRLDGQADGQQPGARAAGQRHSGAGRAQAGVGCLQPAYHQLSLFGSSSTLTSRSHQRTEQRDRDRPYEDVEPLGMSRKKQRQAKEDGHSEQNKLVAGVPGIPAAMV